MLAELVGMFNLDLAIIILIYVLIGLLFLTLSFSYFKKKLLSKHIDILDDDETETEITNKPTHKLRKEVHIKEQTPEDLQTNKRKREILCKSLDYLELSLSEYTKLFKLNLSAKEREELELEYYRLESKKERILELLKDK